MKLDWDQRASAIAEVHFNEDFSSRWGVEELYGENAVYIFNNCPYKENLTARLEGANAKTVDFIQRAAADIVSFQLLLGWRKQAELTKGRYTFAALDAYLYGPLRALLFAAEINGKGPQPAICGESSELIVQAIQVTYRSCPSGGGIVSDEVLALFPKGVESSWNGAPWTAASHSCSAGK